MYKNKPNLNHKKLQNTSLSEKELSVILGGLLGDGSLKIHPNYKNARYSFRHSIGQKSYFDSKVSLLKGLSSAKCVWLQKPDGFALSAKRPLEKLRFCTRALESLTKVHSITSKGNKLVVKRKWLNHLTEQSLAIWWCDDGSIISNGRKGCIATDGFTLVENEILKNYLSVVWNVTVKIYPIKPKGKGVSPQRYRLYLDTKALKAFLTIILPYIPTKDMLYKCTLKYKDINHQQRWISHMEKYVSKQIV